MRVIAKSPRPARAGPAQGFDRDAGFTLVVVLVAVVVTSILLSAAVTTWTHVTRRAAEEELIWRGEQYVKAIQCYMRLRGAPPTELDQLLDARCIRKLYPQPLAEDGEWRLLRISAPGVPAAPPSTEQTGGSGLLGRNLRSSEPIIGVAPGIEGESIRAFDDKRRYEEWEFILGREEPRPPVRALGLPEGFEQGGQSLDEILRRQRERFDSGR